MVEAVRSADGLVQRTSDGVTTINKVWDGQNLLQERVGALVKDVQYTDFPGYWGGLSSQRRGGVSGFFGFDSQGSSRILVSVGGVVTDNYSFKAFGEELASGSGTTNPYRYAGAFGYYRDTANRYYVRARHLSVPDGRWISRDPIGFYGGDWNLYRYVVNNPTNRSDASGLVMIGVHAQAFIHKRISKIFGTPNPWFPQDNPNAPNKNYPWASSSNRIEYQSKGNDEDKIYMSVSIDSCEVGKKPPKIEHTLKPGISAQKLASGVVIRKRTVLKSSFFKAWSEGSCTFVVIGGAAAYPFNPIAKAFFPVVFQMNFQICNVYKKQIFSLHAHLVATQFPDFDIRYDVAGSWTNWNYRRSAYDHPALALADPHAQVWDTNTPNVLAPGDCDDCN